MNFAEAEVSVCFYDRSSADKRAKYLNLLSGRSINHCGLLLRRNDQALILASAKTHRAKFVDEKAYHKADCPPIITTKLGTKMVSYEQLFNYVSEPYKGNTRSLAWWWFLGRFTFPLLLPPTCSLLTCRLLRVIGYKVKDHVEPYDLYKELTSENYSNRRTSGSR
jgi:hypothetical protein